MSILKYLKDKVEKLLNDSTPEHDQQCTWEDGYRCALYKIDGILEDLIKKDSCIYYHEDYGCDISPNKRCDSCDSKVSKPLPSPTLKRKTLKSDNTTMFYMMFCGYCG